MGSVNYQAGDHRSWEAAGLKDFGDFAECISEVDIRPDGFDVTAGTWFYADDDTLTIYQGTFGNDHSPGADHYTSADIYDDPDEYQKEADRLYSLPEFLDDDSDDD